MSLPPDYLRHEHVYGADAAAPGWNSPAVDTEILSYAFELLGAAHVVPPAAILEIGCGMGNLSIALARAGFSVSGIDISPTAVEVATRRAASAGAAARFRAGDVTANETLFPRGRYAAVLDGLCWHCIIGNDRPALLRSVARSLRPGGVFLVITMCGQPRSPRLRVRFDQATRCVSDGVVAERYIGDAKQLLDELRAARFGVPYHRVVAGSDETGDQDLLLAVARVKD